MRPDLRDQLRHGLLRGLVLLRARLDADGSAIPIPIPRVPGGIIQGDHLSHPLAGHNEVGARVAERVFEPIDDIVVLLPVVPPVMEDDAVDLPAGSAGGVARRLDVLVDLNCCHFVLFS